MPLSDSSEICRRAVRL